jgi:hypothetical protein
MTWQEANKMNSQLEELRERVANMLNRDTVDVDASVAAIGIDSLNVVELILTCQLIYPEFADFDSVTFDETSTLRDIHAQMSKEAVTA